MILINNLNFMSGEIKSKYIGFKINKIKKVILSLWVICALLYFIYAYFSYKIKEKEIHINNAVDQNRIASQHEKSKFAKKLDTINTLERFIKDTNINSCSEAIVVSDNKLDLNIEVINEDEYYNILRRIEACPNYKILNLTFVDNKRDKLSFRIALEVKV